MEASANAELVSLLASHDADVRMVALHWLSEGYACQPEICRGVWDVWDRLGVAEGFPEFAMLSHFPVPAEAIQECCLRAQALVDGVALTSPQSRAAGKMIEQVTRLPPEELVPHMNLLRETVAKSKIFFRVDLAGVQARIDLLGIEADQLARELDQAIYLLSENRTDVGATHRGLHALEAIRRQHPNYLDLGAVLFETPPDDGPQAVSFQLVLQSLIHFADGQEEALAKHLLDQREAVYVTVVDALVRAGTHRAADGLLRAFLQADTANRQWIARGLQRVRVKGLANGIASLRSITQDAKLWLMLLVAEIRQMDLEHAGWLAAEVGRIRGHSYALVNALTMYNCVHAGDEGELPLLQSAFVQYLARTQQSLLEERADREEELKNVQAREHKQRDEAREAAIKRFRREK